MKSFKYIIGTYKPKRMTLIIGMVCKEGILLIGDRRVMEDELGGCHYEDKIMAPLENLPVGVACAGLTDLAKEFNRKLNFMVAQRSNQYYWKNVTELLPAGISKEEIEEGKVPNLPYTYTYEDFLDDCATLAQTISEPAKAYVSTPIEVLVAVSTPNGLKLYKIAHTGFKQEGKYFCVGSGSQYIEKFLKDSYYEDIDASKAITIVSFLIKAVEDLGLDKAVGVGDEKLPQIFLISSSYFGNFKLTDEVKKSTLEVIDDRISILQKGFSLFFSSKDSDDGENNEKH